MHRPKNAPDEFWVVQLFQTGFFPVEIYWNGHVEPGWRAVSTDKLMEAQKYYTQLSAEQDLKKIMNGTLLGIWKVTKQTWPSISS